MSTLTDVNDSDKLFKLGVIMISNDSARLSSEFHELVREGVFGSAEKYVESKIKENKVRNLLRLQNRKEGFEIQVLIEGEYDYSIVRKCINKAESERGKVAPFKERLIQLLIEEKYEVVEYIENTFILGDVFN